MGWCCWWGNGMIVECDWWGNGGSSLWGIGNDVEIGLIGNGADVGWGLGEKGCRKKEIIGKLGWWGNEDDVGIGLRGNGVYGETVWGLEWGWMGNWSWFGGKWLMLKWGDRGMGEWDWCGKCMRIGGKGCRKMGMVGELGWWRNEGDEG